MARESRKDRMARIASGIANPNDASSGMAFVNRLRSAFTWFASLDEDAPITEPVLDALLTAKEATQVVEDGCEVAEKLVKAYAIARAKAGDSLFVPDASTTTVYLGLPTHPKRLTVESKSRDTIDTVEMLAAMVRDGLLTVATAEAYRTAFTKSTPFHAVAFKDNPTYEEAGA